MEDKTAEVEYEIKRIQDSVYVDGHVDIIMEPVDKDILNNIQQQPIDPSMIVKNPSRMGMPPDFQMFVQQIPNALSNAMGMKQQKSKDPRTIVHIENKVDFAARGWKYGDRITVLMKKKVEKSEQ